MSRTDVLARVCDAWPLGFEPTARGRGRWQALLQVFRPRAKGSEPVGSASQTRASNTPRNISNSVPRYRSQYAMPTKPLVASG